MNFYVPRLYFGPEKPRAHAVPGTSWVVTQPFAAENGRHLFALELYIAEEFSVDILLLLIEHLTMRH